MTDFRKWLSIGTGVGIEIGRDDLTITVVKVRPSGPTVLGDLTINRFREQPASEWGETYNAFLRKLGLRHLAATVLLPRSEIIVRQIHLPGVADKDLAAALRFEIDSLHPYSDEEPVYDWKRVGRTSALLVGIARQAMVERYTTLFAEAGIKIASFSLSAATIYSALRLFSSPPADGFLAFGELDGELEAYGESPARPLFSTRMDETIERARLMAISELRLDPETEPKSLAGSLPAPIAKPADYDADRSALAYSTALAAATQFPALSVNLLPAQLRRASSRVIYVPTIVLASLLALAVGAWAALPSFENSRYLAKLNAEIARVRPQADRATALDRQIMLIQNRSQTIDNFRMRSKDDMDALSELTKVLPPPTWLSSLQLTREAVSLAGETEQAAALLKVIDSSRQFKRSEFTIPMLRGPTGENFSIHAVREGVR